jgi:pSer/pThr/pTyr-binding forkhead associated (FHA) protein
VVLEHASISRQHAALCYNLDRGVWQVLDLGTTHGTFVDSRPVVKVRLASPFRKYLFNIAIPHLGLTNGSVWVGDGATVVPHPETLSGMGLDASPSSTDSHYGTGMGLVRPAP